MTETAILPESESTISDTPPETAFRKRYNDHLEMPTSIIGSICIHVAIVFALIFVLFRLIDGPVKPIIPIVMVDQGEDEEGKGNPETGKAPETLAKGTNAPTSDDLAKLNLPSTLPRKNEIQDQLRVDSAEADIKMPESDQLAYAVLDKHLSDKLLGIGQHNGEGNSNGHGGFGSDSTRARSMRWVMRFQVQDGRDYLRQLAALKATLLIPIPPVNKEMMIFEDLTTGAPNRQATSAEIDRLSRQMRFCDTTSKAVTEIAQQFRLNFTPQCFFAFFPKDLEARLARDEENFRGRKAKDIEETIFKVTVTGGAYEIRIVDQTMKKK